jgi:hypothetical protein
MAAIPPLFVVPSRRSCRVERNPQEHSADSTTEPFGHRFTRLGDGFFLCAAAVPPAAGLDSSLRDARFCAVERFPILAEACALVGALRVVGAGARFFAPGFAACRATVALLAAAAGFFRGVRFVGGICLAEDSGNGPADASGTNTSRIGPV